MDNGRFKNEYFAADTSDHLVSYLQSKSSSWFTALIDTDYLEKVKKSWMSYHGCYYDNTHSITFGGEAGELVNIAVNHYRNIAQHMLNMVTATRPAFQAKAINTDAKSSIQVQLAQGLLEYYMREKRLETDLKKAVEYAIVMGSGFIKMEWNATAGEIYDTIEAEYELDEFGNPVLDEEGEPVVRIPAFPIYEGDVEFNVLSPFDVVFDSTKESSKHDWQLCRTFKNKFDLAAKYPELAEEIKGLQTKSDMQKYRVTLTPYDETVDVPVYEFFHRPTEALPKGRYVVYLSEDIVLIDTVMPYRKLPIFRITPGDILGTPYGYTAMFDLLPLQDAVNSLYSTILTNQSTFGVQNIIAEKNADISVSELAGGLNLIEINPGSQPPSALNLTQTPGEIFNFVKMLEDAMQVISGINAVARGNMGDGEKNIRSGNALALLQSQALQFMSGLQQSYIQLIEDVGTNLVQLLKDFAEVPRIATISGKSNQTYMKYFSKEDLNSINRVIVDAGNALSQCLAYGTPVLMADGSIKEVQDIKIGEKIMGPDSKPRTVGNTNSGQEPMYSVTSKDKHRKVKYECNESHILTLRYCSDDNRYNVKRGDVIDITVRDYMKLPKRHKRLLQGFTVGVEFEKKAVEIPAYILGSWLGDGNSANAAITSMDSEIVEEWRSYAESLGLSLREQDISEHNKAKTYFITSGQASGSNYRNAVINKLRSYNLIDNKHIPKDYLINSEKNRLELLAGLLDTDGTLVDGTTFVISQKRKELIDSMEYLAKSLGFRVCKRDSYSSLNGIKYPKAVLTIGGDTHRIPTRLPRKQARVRTDEKNWLNYGINVECLGDGTYYGFTLVEEPHFLLGDFTVTHNTTAGKVEMASQLIQMGIIKTPEEYMSVINTGKLENMTEGDNKELILVRREREALIDSSIKVVALLTDDHSLHIREHKAVLADPELRLDNELVTRVIMHIQEHIDILQNPNVGNILSLLGQQPLPPQGGTPPNPQTTAPQQPNQQGQQEAANLLQNPEAQSLAMQDQVNNLQLPQPAQPAGSGTVLPEQPANPGQLAAMNGQQ